MLPHSSDASHTGCTKMRGDVLLYRTGGILKDRIVCAYTAGPFCHGEIDLGDGSTVGAHSEDGISRTHEHLLERRVVISLQDQARPERIEAGIAWVLQRVGEPFSWASIADLALPAWLSTLFFGRRSDYNCASLIAQYLEIVGALKVLCDKRATALASPNDIARAFGPLPPARGWRNTRLCRTAAATWALVPARRRALRTRVPGERAGHIGIAGVAQRRYDQWRAAKAATADRMEG
jgi:hypothetical protein